MTATPPATKSDEAAAPEGELKKTDQAEKAEEIADQDVTDADADVDSIDDSIDEGDDEDDDAADDDAPRVSSGVGTGAAAVVSTVLGFAALTGTWTSRVAAERQTLIGQLTTAQTSTPAEQVAAIYGDAWHLTALVNGGFALLALVVGVVVLARPAFGTPGSSSTQAGWVRSVAWAGVALGVLGMIISAGMYLDLFASMPTPPATGAGAGAGQ
ncbi:hypothetical protein [Streptomyces spiramyceticus]|uniref:hypothetical protein n=1 Tax=Streptomyces spiramyceticus TaxID=299717 RepID=UPI00237B00A6|nr:hypothetical protein [Streptomyces spiramyceticus]